MIVNDPVGVSCDVQLLIKSNQSAVAPLLDHDMTSHRDDGMYGRLESPGSATAVAEQ